MRPLFNQNLSHKLVGRLADVFPDSEHVRNLGMKSATERAIRACRRLHDREQRRGLPGTPFRSFRRVPPDGLDKAWERLDRPGRGRVACPARCRRSRLAVPSSQRGASFHRRLSGAVRGGSHSPSLRGSRSAPPLFDCRLGPRANQWEGILAWLDDHRGRPAKLAPRRRICS